MIDFFVWTLPLTGVFGGRLLLSNMHRYVEQLGIRNPLEKKGIFDPFQKIKLCFIYLFADLLFKINVQDWSFSWQEEDAVEYDLIAIFYGMLIILAVMFLLCKYFLPSISVRNIRKTSSSTNYSVWGAIMSAVFIMDLLFSYIIQFNTCWYFDDMIGLLFTIICLSVGVYLSMYPYIYLKRYDRIKGEAVRTISSMTTHRAPIIFLRSFEIDRYVVNGYSFDEYVCKSFSMTSQPILSLSDPDDFLPTGGSIKIQSYDNRWKDAIISLFKNCRAVVIFEGKSEGLQWEIENLKKYIAHDQLFVATPPKKYRKAVWCRGFLGSERKYALKFIWKRFANHLIKEGFAVPISDPGSDVVFNFNDKWMSAENGNKLRGKALFDFILDNTVKYEKRDCNYEDLATELSSYELSLNLTNSEKTRINNAIWKITVVIVAIEIVITVLT